ncbi:MAG: hypothetical protein WCA08_11855 [Desulfoferrobacter sp.]
MRWIRLRHIAFLLSSQSAERAPISIVFGLTIEHGCRLLLYVMEGTDLMMIQEELDTLKLSLLFLKTTYPFDREYIFHDGPEGGTMLIGLRFKLLASLWLVIICAISVASFAVYVSVRNELEMTARTYMQQAVGNLAQQVQEEKYGSSG